MDEKPKIIVDSDWKQQAQAEKARLSAKEAEKASAQPDQDPNRPVDFTDLVQSLTSQALLYLGAIPEPETGRSIVAPDMAKMSIDMLGVVEEKTKGNLTDEESELITSILRELRMQFVEVSKAIAKAVEEGKLKPQQGGGYTASPNPPPNAPR